MFKHINYRCAGTGDVQSIIQPLRQTTVGLSVFGRPVGINIL